jgi:hypothetical protein
MEPLQLPKLDKCQFEIIFCLEIFIFVVVTYVSKKLTVKLYRPTVFSQKATMKFNGLPL